MYVIQKGIKIPDITCGPYGSATKSYPLDSMVVGDSFIETLQTRSLVASRIGAWGGRSRNKKFVTRNVPGGVRVWRVV